MHPLYVFFALLGGVEVFGIIGLFAGPVILALAAALLKILEDELGRDTSPAGA
jgi:predicted PurR-regulated permease PerM